MPIIGGGSSSSAGAAADGWTATTETWTRTGSFTFAVAGVDVTAKYSPGTRIKLTQTTIKYFVVASSAFSTDTTVTLATNADYTLVAAAITNTYYSYQANPQGFPAWFNWTPGFTGFSANPTVGSARFTVVGRTCTITYIDNAGGTSNATTYTITGAPIAAQFTSPNTSCFVQDNSVTQTTPGTAQITAGTTVITMGKTSNASGGFTASGGKACAALVLVYAI